MAISFWPRNRHYALYGENGSRHCGQLMMKAEVAACLVKIRAVAPLAIFHPESRRDHFYKDHLNGKTITFRA